MRIWVGPEGRRLSSHLRGSNIRRREAIRRVMRLYRIEVGTMENSLEIARWGVAIGRSNSARIEAKMNASALRTRDSSDLQNSRPYRSMLRVQASRILRMAVERRPLSLLRERARGTLNVKFALVVQ